MDLAERKRRLRHDLRERLRALTPAEAREAARSVAALLAGSLELATAKRVILYAALPEELPSRPLFDAARAPGRQALLPRPGPEGHLEFAVPTSWEALVPGRYGVLEPRTETPASRLESGDLVLVPGLAFDLEGNRLGRGGGWWDRTLAAAEAEELRLVGVGFACQVVGAVPHGAGDRAMHAILTERGWHRVGAGRGT